MEDLNEQKKFHCIIPVFPNETYWKQVVINHSNKLHDSPNCCLSNPLIGANILIKNTLKIVLEYSLNNFGFMSLVTYQVESK